MNNSQQKANTLSRVNAEMCPTLGVFRRSMHPDAVLNDVRWKTNQPVSQPDTVEDRERRKLLVDKVSDKLTLQGYEVLSYRLYKVKPLIQVAPDSRLQEGDEIIVGNLDYHVLMRSIELDGCLVAWRI
ncbi:hypothetical protein [Thaumasiovibrio sp. DFM-14]|uniref:hypothetical protein n=1 Tax=Thaumasiovibrio sp. DFM-14 TaxID=3384792 RepID=UPI0039A24743